MYVANQELVTKRDPNAVRRSSILMADEVRHEQKLLPRCPSSEAASSRISVATSESESSLPRSPPSPRVSETVASSAVNETSKLMYARPQRYRNSHATAV